MTDITELAQSLKAAADSVIKNYDCEWFETGSQICTVHKSKVNLISLANPANILALVEALEKAQGMEAYWKVQCRGITDHCEVLQARIAELESRTVKLPAHDRFFDYAEMALIYRDEQWQRTLATAGIKWEAE